MMEWVSRTLDELGYVSRGRSRHRPRDAGHLYGGPYPFVQTGDIKHAGLYLTQYTQTYSETGLEQSRMWPVGTLCITIAANIAETSILGIEACFPDSVIGFIPDRERADARFLKYLFDATLQRRFKQFTQGTAQDNLSQAKLLSLKLSGSIAPRTNSHRFHPLRLRRPDREQPAADSITGTGGADDLQGVVCAASVPWA